MAASGPAAAAPSLDETLSERARLLKPQADHMRAIRLKLYEDTPTVADPPQTQTALASFRLASWGFANSSAMDEFPTPEAAARRAADIRRSQATAAIVRGRHFRLNWLSETPRIMAYYETAARACRGQGLIPLAHLDFNIGWQPAFPIMLLNPQWPQRSLQDGTPTRWFCLNHPTLREAFARHVEDIARRGMDGFMLDEITFITRDHFHCGCEHCRAQFERKTGLRLPEVFDRNIIGNPESPLWRLWQEWQAQSLTQFRLFLLQRLRGVNPSAFLMNYSTNIYYPSDASSNTFESGRVCFAGAEGADLVWGAAPSEFAQHRTALAFSRFWGRPAWAQYPAVNEGDQVFSIWFAPIAGVAPWGWLRAWQDEKAARPYQWEHLAEAYAQAEPVADLAVLLASVNRSGPPERGAVHSAETYGWMQAMGLRGVQFSPVPGKYVLDKDLAPYKAVVVPQSEQMSLQAIEAVQRFVARGGVAIVSGVPGRYDALGFPLGQGSLLRRMGLQSIEDTQKVFFDSKTQRFLDLAPQTLTLEPGFLPSLPRQIEVPPGYRFTPSFPPGAAYAVLARFSDGAPAICAIPSGQGRYLYLSFLPGLVSCQPRASQATLVERWHSPPVLDFIREMAREALGRAESAYVEGDGLLATVWRKDRRVWARMLNVAGALRLPVGKPIGKAEPVYPPLDAVRVHLRLPVQTAATLFTPDRSAPLRLAARQEEGGQVIEVPAGAFERFAFIRMEIAP